MNKKNKAEIIICFGDSITEQGGSSPNGWTFILQERLNASDKSNYIVHNAGVGGNTTANALDRFHTDVLPYLPAIVIIEFGINDSFVNLHTKQNRLTINEFKRKLKELVRLIKINNGTCLLIANHILDDAKSYKQGNDKTLSANLMPYNKFIREFARQNNIQLIDMEFEMLKAKINIEEFLQPDGVHLTPEGMKQYGEFIWPKLREKL